MASTSAVTSASSPQGSWSDLPSDILSKIAKTLDTRIDALHCRAVCNSWRSSIPLPPKTPPSIKLPFPIHPYPGLNRKIRGHFLLTESIVYAFEPLATIPNNKAKTWIIKTQVSSESGKVMLKDPFFKDTSKNLAIHLPDVLNLLDYKVVEVSKAHDLEFVEESNILHTKFNNMKSYIRVQQLAISCSGLDKVDDGFVIMALQRGSLAVWRMGDERWTEINDNRESSRYDYIAFHDGYFFAVDCHGFTLKVDAFSLDISIVGPERICGSVVRSPTNYLVKSLGDLFLVVKHQIVVDYTGGWSDDEIDSIIMFKIYKFNKEKCYWSKVNRLEFSRVFFTGMHSSFSVSAKDFAGCKGNCIYFTEGRSIRVNDNCPGSDVEIFDLDYDISRPLFKFPGYSNIFWPPPTWLKRNPCE